MPRGRPKKVMNEDKVVEQEEVISPVAPLESVEVSHEVKVTEPCWNCGNQLQDGVCEKCGFDKASLYNLNLEAAKAAERQKAQQLVNK